jgi:hypothetical protein
MTVTISGKISVVRSAEEIEDVGEISSEVVIEKTLGKRKLL